jgi:2-methylcitrate dehydratase PrpD
MQRSFVYGTVRETQRSAIYVIRVKDALIDAIEAGEIAERMREKVLSRGETPTDVVVVQGDSKETLRLYGTPYSVNRVRAAMFNAAISWQKIELE